MAARPPIRRPELGELEALIVALRAGSIGEAARRLGVSQPALSKKLRQLEAVVGTRLLERSPAGVVATPAGARLATAALRVVDEIALLDDVLAELRGQAAPVRIASSPVVAESLLPELLAAARTELTGLPIELTAANSAVVRRLVATGAADIGIAASDGDGGADLTDGEASSGARGSSSSTDPADEGAPVLATDEIVVAIPPGHPWHERDTLTLADVAAEPLVLRDPRSHARAVLDRAIADRGLVAQPPLAELGSTSAAVAAALETGAPAVLSRLALGDDTRLIVRRLDDLQLPRRFVVLTAPDAHARAAVRRAAAALIAAAAAMSA